jgi:hypothetical protein
MLEFTENNFLAGLSPGLNPINTKHRKIMYILNKLLDLKILNVIKNLVHIKLILMGI